MSPALGYSIEARDGRARAGRVRLARGGFETPVFMPVGSCGTVKGLAPWELREMGVGILLGNTYHLALRPGLDVIEPFGGLHRFMGWEGPILTDSGGFQVFSLARLRKITDEGVAFSSHIDGSPCFIGPEESMRIQRALNSDIVMCFDECPPYPSTREVIERSVARTLAWARVCREKHAGNPNALFGIIQGGMLLEMRKSCAQELAGIGFDGYAVGGLSVGEPTGMMFETLDGTVSWMPEDRPRYLMGAGTPLDLLNAVALGVDMFDCVMPTRNARNGMAFTRFGPVTVRNSRHRQEDHPVEEGCTCACCRHFSRAYVRHLINAREMLGPRLLTLHNVHFYMRLMREMRASIVAGTFTQFKRQFEADYGFSDEDSGSGRSSQE